MIYVPQDSRFSFKLDAVNPGWINQGIDKTLHPMKLDGLEGSRLSKKEAKFLRDRNLWIVFEITSVSAREPLRTNSKKIIIPSLVKYDAGSFGLLPMDEEDISFSLDAIRPYQVKLTIYEIKELNKKRIFSNGLKENSGIWKMITGTYDTLLSTGSSLIGDDIFDDFFKREYGEDLAMERIALLTGAKKQFQASFSIYRSPEKATDQTAKFDTYAFVDRHRNYSLENGTIKRELESITIGNANKYHEVLTKNYEKNFKPDRYGSFVIATVVSTQKPELSKEVASTQEPKPEIQVDKTAQEALQEAIKDINSAVGDLTTKDPVPLQEAIEAINIAPLY